MNIGAMGFAGQARGAASESPLDGMSIEELRAFQSFLFPVGGRDPLVMRFPTQSELGIGEKLKTALAPTFDEQERKLHEWLTAVTDSIKIQDYAQALKVAQAAMNTVDNEWPPIKPEHIELLRVDEEIRSLGRMASRLKNQQDISNEFYSLGLRVDGIVWSPVDAKAVVNGLLLAAGEVMLKERKQGDLRVEMIEEHGVVFQFKGMRFRLPVQVYAPAGPTPE